MAQARQFRQDSIIPHGTTAQTNLKLTDIMPVQHEDLATQTNKMHKINLAQCLCEPYAVSNSNNPSNGAYVADCVNFPDFALSFTDGQGNSHNLVGLKVRVKFTYGITYGSVSGGTYPTLNINGSGAIPLLAQGKTMATGAISAGQTVEFTVIPYGNSLAYDADSNVRESTSDYTIYTDGFKVLPENKVDSAIYDNSITDCNDAWQKGKTVTYVLSQVSNLPYLSDYGYYVLSQCNPASWSNNNYITQIATPANNVNINEMYIRHAYLQSGVMAWTDWERVVKASEIRASNNDDYLVDITNTVTKYLGAGSTFVRKVNNMVYLQINGTYTGSPSTATQLLIEDIPLKYRPRMVIEGFALLGYNSNQYVTVARGRITTDGKLYLQETSWDTNTAIRCCVIYFLN